MLVLSYTFTFYFSVFIYFRFIISDKDMKHILKWPGKTKFIVSILKNNHGIKWN